MKKLNSLLPYVIVFLATFLILQYIQGNKEEAVVNDGTFIIETSKDSYAIGKDIRVNLKNNTENAIVVESRCPETYFDVYRYTSEAYELVSETEAIDLERNCEDVTGVTIEPGKKETVSLLDYSYSLFGETGRYKLNLVINDTVYSSPEFEIKEPGFITKMWRELLYKPILNALVAILIYVPGHYLWAAVILLTLIIRTILLIPSQKAMRAQKAMQDVQPKLNEIKKKYANDQARLAQETMLIWKEHKVNPVSSCLPMLIQFPILIALFYVINGGLSPDRTLMIYDFLPSFSLAEINPQFLNFNLLDRSILIFPLVIGSLQFVQMQLMSTKKAARSAQADKKEKSGPGGMASEMESATNMMKYMMPVMIAFFTAQLPAAVGLYWGTTTFYGIIQQLVVNKGGTPKSSSKKDGVTIRVINKKHGKKD